MRVQRLSHWVWMAEAHVAAPDARRAGSILPMDPKQLCLKTPEVS